MVDLISALLFVKSGCFDFYYAYNSYNHKIYLDGAQILDTWMSEQFFR